MTQAAGWYEDPNDPTLMRYFDGVVWSDRTMPKVKPGLEGSTISTPRPVAPPQPGQQMPGQPSGPAPGQSPSPWQGQWSAPPQPGQPPHGYPHPQGGGMPWQAGPLASDGRPLSGWWRRVGAHILDGVLVTIAVAPVSLALFLPHQEELMAWYRDMLAGGTAPMSESLARAALTQGLLTTALWVLYETLALARWGRTVGRAAVGIAVQRVGGTPVPAAVAPTGPAAPPPAATGIGTRAALIRSLVKHLPSALQQIPAVGFVFLLFSVVDVLFPLFDRRRQALHDKPAGTEVVRTR